MKVRKAQISDVRVIAGLITHYAQAGEMLSRPLSYLYEHIRDYTVAEEGEEVLGCGALHVLWEDLVEVVSLAVREKSRGNGVGRRIVASLLEEAGTMGTEQVFALTYRPTFFRELGFVPIERETLPHKVWRDCIQCSKFPDCGEVALAFELNGKPKDG
jgi:amino-acid N-acetyltransferase